MLALLAFPPSALAEDEPCETRIYDLRELLRPISDFPGPGISVHNEDAEASPTSAFELADEPRSLMTGEQLVKLLQDDVEPASWQEESDRASLTLTAQGQLIVVHRRAVQEKAGRFLAMLRQVLNQTVNVDCMVLRLEPEVLKTLAAGDGGPTAGAGGDGAPIFLSPSDMKTLLNLSKPGGKVCVEKRGRITAMNAQRTHLYDAREAAWLGDYDVEIATRATSYDPIIHLTQLGLLVDVRAIANGTGSRFLLEVRFTNTVPARPSETFLNESAGAALQLPAIDNQEIRTTLAVPTGDGVLVGTAGFAGMDDGAGKVTALLLRPCLVGATPHAKGRYDIGEGTSLGVFDVQSLVVSLIDFPGSSLRLAPLTEGELGSGGATIEEQAASKIMTGEDMTEFIRNNVAKGTWDTAPNSIEYSNGYLLVRHSPDVLTQIEGALAAIERDSGRLVTTEVRFLAVDDTLLDELDTSDVNESTGVLSPEKLADLMAASRAGEHARLVGSAQVTGHNTQRVHSERFRATRYVKDYDTEIAEDAVIQDPIPAWALEGVSLDVRPTLVLEDHQIQLELRPILAQKVGDIAKFDTHVAKTGPVQFPTVDILQAPTTLIIPDGGTMLVGFGSRPESEAGRLRHILMLVTATSVTLE